MAFFPGGSGTRSNTLFNNNNPISEFIAANHSYLSRPPVDCLDVTGFVTTIIVVQRNPYLCTGFLSQSPFREPETSTGGGGGGGDVELGGGVGLGDEARGGGAAEGTGNGRTDVAGIESSGEGAEV